MVVCVLAGMNGLCCDHTAVSPLLPAPRPSRFAAIGCHQAALPLALAHAPTSRSSLSVTLTPALALAHTKPSPRRSLHKYAAARVGGCGCGTWADSFCVCLWHQQLSTHRSMPCAIFSEALREGENYKGRSPGPAYMLKPTVGHKYTPKVRPPPPVAPTGDAISNC